MASDRDRALFEHYRTEVEAMLAVGRPLAAVERMLERAPLDPDERSGLWLLGWALHEIVGPAEPVELKVANDGLPDRSVHR